MAAAKPPELPIPGVEQLESTPEILRVLMTSVTEEDALWKPAADRFSIAEVLEHLSHVEAHCFRLRVDLTVEQNGAAWEPYDPEGHAAAGHYSGRDPEESFAHWEEQREDNVEFLKSLPADAVSRHGIHRTLGRVTLGELVAEWAFHDLGHIRQIAELIRARKYYPSMGPFQKQSKVKP
ncbi:MAG TPA: DinB family protein [Bryobacteraceae bacterium]|nr:DinB family protein [Bryobacteraceae bacterium]